MFLRDLCALLSVISVLGFAEGRQGIALGLRNRAPKRKSPDWHRGALSYAHNSTRLVLTLSSQK